MKIITFLTLAVLFITACQEANSPSAGETMAAVDEENLNSATFAGGCFWCTEADFEKLHGVKEAVSGYTGGSTEHPSYEEVSSGATGHVESVQVYYDPQKITYEELLDYFWQHIDPTDPGGQFVDRGEQYRSVIFYHHEKQKELAEASKQALSESGIFEKPIVTEILPLTAFYKAEEYHQDYYQKSSIKYKFYRYRSGGINSWKRPGAIILKPYQNHHLREKPPI